MAIYHFSGQIMSRISKNTGKPKSPLACAAYRSGERLIDDIDNKVFFYKRDVMPITHILSPTNAPEWASDRKRLWNEVNKIEKNYNAQFAREFNVALPVELTNEQQEKLTLDFCQEAFVDRGMVADIAIHRDDEDNPHFHVMLTVRPFNEGGSWGIKARREYKLDDKGNHILDKNGKKAFYKVNTIDWNTKDVFNIWRKLWADKANQYLKENGIKKSISHLSNEDRGIEQMPTIHEGYIARKMESNGQRSDRVSLNKDVKKYNQKVSDLQKFKLKKEHLLYQNKFSRKFSPMEKKNLSDIAKQLKMFVNVQSISERKQQLSDWKNSIQFTKDSDSKLKQLARIEKEENLVESAEEIFNLESTRFIEKNYPAWDVNSLTLDEKIMIVDKTIQNNELLSEDELDFIEEEVYSANLLKQINGILQDRFAFVLTINHKLESLISLKSELEKKLDISPSAFESTLKRAALKNPKEFEKLKSIIKNTGDLFKARDLMNEFYDLEIKKLYPMINAEKLSLDEKEILLVGTEYYEKSITLESIPTLQRYSLEDQVSLINLLTDDDLLSKETINKLYPTFQLQNPRYLLLFKDECLRNIEQLPSYASELLKNINPEEFATSEINKSTFVKELNVKMDEEIDSFESNSLRTGLPSGVTNGLLQGLLEKRNFGSKKQFEEDLSSKSKKRNIHKSGASL
ncbi:MobA/MobL family protein [Peribacillus muralis]|uniref:MobQ family relaxase n=1 Tax=Peribacillus muralis TaxID=264697 RepID=UPI001F4D5666|nr:MobQ family relaxase [Peribacillus muralis]MCK1995474.1 MobA/MobL family protein [Peribacillus muralis]MCK2016057.1 MobA/MobL family protein [Peribacillus muralis]